MPYTMHSFENSSNVPAFLIKLWKLVEDPKCDDLIAWSDSGYSFVIKDQARFAKELLPQYFKHNNMASFIRQLNMYGFKKVMNIERSGLRNENDQMEFQNMFFLKEKSELLELIKRKIPNARVVAETPSKTNAKEILIDLSSIREKQESVGNMLLKMKKENELLWRELHSMRQKHKAQEQIIQKVIQFLVSIVQRSNQNIGVQRKISRMIHSSPKASSSQVSVVRKNNSLLVPDGVVSPLGPVIHEIMEGEHDESPSSTSHVQNSLDTVESLESKSPEVTTPDSPKVTRDSINMLEALTPKAASSESSSRNVDNSILGIPLNYITLPQQDNMNVLSIPENTEICNTISIPDCGMIESSDVGNVISLPDDSSVNNVISIDGVESNIGSVVSITSSDSVTPESQSVEKDSSNLCTTVSTTDFIPDSDNLDYSFDISDLDLPSTSYSLPKDDYDDQVSLNTPKVVISDEDIFASLVNDRDKSSEKGGQLTPKKNSVTHDEHNYQMTTDSALAKNVLSNHLLSVDEKLSFTQDKLSSNPWNMDVQSLLGVCGLQNIWSSLESQLFSSDEMLNCESFANSLSDEINIKTEPSDIAGNELVQFMPPLSLFEGLNEQPEVSNEDQTTNFGCLDGSLDLQQNIFSETPSNESESSKAVELLEQLERINQAKHKKSKGTPKGKRRKIK